jgi:hypothetical protein
MNARHWLLSHPVVLQAAALMRSGGLTPDTICRSIDEALRADLPSERERADVIRTLRRCLKIEATGTIETSGMEDTRHSIPAK